MRNQRIFRANGIISAVLIVLIATGCAGTAQEPTSAPSAIPEVLPTSVPTEAAAPEPTPVVVSDPNVLYQDDFTNPASGWPEEKFDNYFIGYHEPEYYHIEITSAKYKTTVFEPAKDSFEDVVIEVKAFTVSAKTAETGDFTYGLAFRRSGDQYYAFTISPRTKKWFVLKNSSNALVVLAEGTEESIHNLDTEDILRVDAQGSNFTFHINDRMVSQVTDSEYASGEVGYYTQTFDSPNIHIHFDALSIRKFDTAQTPGGETVMIYQDDFTNPASGWAEKKFDNYFIGYHEPEYYHIEVTSTNYKTTVFEPNKQSLADVTVEVKTFTVSAKTSEAGDFNYGPVFRRSGDQYYAFTISPRTKKWYVLKSSSNALVVLAEGTAENINDLDVEDVLRVDAQGSNFSFHINDQLVTQVTDSDYASGEIGFYVQTLDSPNLHVHFDSVAIRNFDAPLVCNIKALALNVRSGPGKDFSSSLYLSQGDIVVPTGRSADGEWLKIELDDNNAGWVFSSDGFLTCTGAIDSLPLAQP